MEIVYAKFRAKAEDFIVEEITKDKRVCSIKNLDTTFPKDEERDFLWCDLIKNDIDEFRALRELASGIGKGIDAIGFAGTKDKKAITSQQISIFKPSVEKIKSFSHPNLQIGNFKWNKRKIKLGFLDGNHFIITLRDITPKDAIKISNLIKKTKFFPNYFGKQRFGSVRNNNDEIGKLIIKKKFKEAIIKILTETSSNEREEVVKARQKLAKEKDFKKALEYFPMYLKFERNLLYYLSQNKDDFIGALKKIDRKQVLMFVNALQSKLFNEILEESIEAGFDFSQKGQQKIQLIGYKSKDENTKVGIITKEIMKRHNLTKEDFDLREIPFLRISGQLRDAIIDVQNLTLEINNDDLFENSKKITLDFCLPSGVYATTFLENFFELDEKRDNKNETEKKY